MPQTAVLQWKHAASIMEDGNMAEISCLNYDNKNEGTVISGHALPILFDTNHNIHQYS